MVHAPAPPRLTWLPVLSWHVPSEVSCFSWCPSSAWGRQASRPRSLSAPPPQASFPTRVMRSTVRGVLGPLRKFHCVTSSVPWCTHILWCSYDAASKKSTVLNRRDHVLVTHVRSPQPQLLFPAGPGALQQFQNAACACPWYSRSEECQVSHATSGPLGSKFTPKCCSVVCTCTLRSPCALPPAASV